MSMKSSRKSSKGVTNTIQDNIVCTCQWDAPELFYHYPECPYRKYKEKMLNEVIIVGEI